LAREQELKHLTNELESLEFAFEASATGDKSLKKRIHDLEMQLDTVNIKIAETEDTRRNYELNISNLQEEEMAYLRDLDALRYAQSLFFSFNFDFMVMQFICFALCSDARTLRTSICFAR
jgi:septal ring factor EnvC (AmiA/AmiB activator)